jgi:hypothetical protein
MSYPVYLPNIGGTLAAQIDEELRRARNKFPDNKHINTALAEEVGELSQALLWTEETFNGHPRASSADVRREALQVAVMAIRVITEGDSDFPAYEPTGGAGLPRKVVPE